MFEPDTKTQRLLSCRGVADYIGDDRPNFVLDVNSELCINVEYGV